MFENVPLLSFCASYIFNSALTLIKRPDPDLMKYLAELSDREKGVPFLGQRGQDLLEIATILGISRANRELPPQSGHQQDGLKQPQSGDRQASPAASLCLPG